MLCAEYANERDEEEREGGGKEGKVGAKIGNEDKHGKECTEDATDG